MTTASGLADTVIAKPRLSLSEDKLRMSTIRLEKDRKKKVRFYSEGETLGDN